MDKKKIEVEIVRKEGKTYFRFKIHPSIENLYKSQNPEIRESKSWPALKFYYIPQLINNEVYQSKLSSFNLIDDYGSSFYDRNRRRLNIAWLRTVNGVGEILIEEEFSFAELSQSVKNALSFIKEYFEEYYREFKIKGSVSVEL